MWLTETHNDEIFNGLNLTKLGIDEYYIKFISSNQGSTLPLYLYSKFQDCYKCPYTLSGPILVSDTVYYTKKSSPAEDWKILTRGDEPISLVGSTDHTICSASPNVGEFGVYAFDVANCNTQVLKEPVNIYAGFLTVLLLTLLFTCLGYAFKFTAEKIYKARKNRHNLNGNAEDAEKNVNIENAPKKTRVQSLDTFRGISIVIMIFVNYGAGHYEFLEHATWNGLNVADLVFPWFMWIMGVCIPISIRSATKGNTCILVNFYNILRRSCILFLLGVFLNRGLVLENIRIFGVLQRFGLCYFFVASLMLFLSKLKIPESNSRILMLFQDIITLLPHWSIILVIMTIHLAITFHLDVPGCPDGYLGPGGLHENGLYSNCTGGVTAYIDEKILGIKHLYQNPTARHIYKSGPFDPEGFFGTLNSIVQVFIGCQAGSTMLTYKSHKARLIRWLSWAVVTGLIGGILCNFSKEDGVIPVNKNLWSLSFVMVTSCFAFILLSACYVIIDVYHLWSGKPFLFAGMNATIMYVGHSLTDCFPFLWALTPMNTHYLYLAMSVWATSLWVLIAYGLYINKFFLSI